MPGIRSLLVLVAGYSGVGAGRASLFGGISALSWYLLMSVAGVELGYNLQALESLMSRYEIIVWAAFAAMAAAWAVNRALGRRRLAG
jgi:membrane protein DedA with SNARE-associated domain